MSFLSEQVDSYVADYEVPLKHQIAKAVLIATATAVVGWIVAKSYTAIFLSDKEDPNQTPN